MDQLAHNTVFLIPLAFIIATAMVILASFSYRLKKQILDSGRTDDELLKVLSAPTKDTTGLLKWGLIFLFGGLGLVVIQFIPDAYDWTSLPFGVEAIFLALGFLTYYFLTKKGGPEQSA